MRELQHKRQEVTSLREVRKDHYNRYKYAFELASMVASDRKVEILDLGCGVGYGSYMLAKYGNFKTVGVDIDASAIEKARKHFNHELIDYQNIDIRRSQCIKFPDHFEFTIAFEIIEHLFEPEPVLKYINNRNCKWLIGSVPNEDAIPFNKDKHPWHAKHYTQFELIELLSLSGWSVKRLCGQKGKHGDDATITSIKDVTNPRTLIFIAKNQNENSMLY